MKTKISILMVLVGVLLAGCASNQITPVFRAYTNAPTAEAELKLLFQDDPVALAEIEGPIESLKSVRDAVGKLLKTQNVDEETDKRLLYAALFRAQSDWQFLVQYVDSKDVIVGPSLRQFYRDVGAGFDFSAGISSRSDREALQALFMTVIQIVAASKGVILPMTQLELKNEKEKHRIGPTGIDGPFFHAVWKEPAK